MFCLVWAEDGAGFANWPLIVTGDASNMPFASYSRTDNSAMLIPFFKIG